MSEPILVVDPGTAWTTAAVVTAGRSELLKEPASGSYCWPTSVALDGETLLLGTLAERRKRADLALYAGQLTASLRPDRQVTLGGRNYPARELLSALLGGLKTEAERLARMPIERILLLRAEEPVTSAGREMVAAAAAAGFIDVELLFQPAAAAMAPADQTGQHPGAPGGGQASSQLVLVCDAGASALRLTLVSAAAPGRPGTSRGDAAVTACGGDRLDALLIESLGRDRNSRWIMPLITAQGAPGVRARLDLAELARRMRHELTDAEQTEDTLNPLNPVVRFSREDLEKMMKPALGQLSSACRDLLGKAGDVTAPRVMLVGGCAQTPAIQRALSSALGRPVQSAPAPELVALRGGIVWAESAGNRRVAAVPVPVGLRGLAWQVPGGAARLIGYTVPPGADCEAGQTLARVRDDDDAIWDLISDAPGILEQCCAATSSIVTTADVLMVARPKYTGRAERRGSPLRLAVLPGGRYAWFGQNSRQFATADAAGTVCIWETETVAELRRFWPPAPPRQGCLATAMTAQGHWLIAHFDGGSVVIQDVTAGCQKARVAKGNDLRMVQFSSDGRYLCTFEGKQTRIWEASGRELMSVKERLLSDDGITMSRDGRWLGLVSRSGVEVWEQPGAKRFIVRQLPRFKGRVRHLCFSADSTKILFAFDSRLELISLAAGEVLWSIDVQHPVRSAEFTPEGSWLATVPQPVGYSSASLRDAATGRELAQIPSPNGACSWVRFSPDGRFMISEDGDHAVLWALAY
jgi:hypothetical protein